MKINLENIQTIDEVIEVLGQIVADSEQNNDASGYFAALYQKVTVKVKEGVAGNFFDNGPRMEKLDVIFAKRYIDAWRAQQVGEAMTESWQRAFGISTNFSSIVFQHLLIGMNAHINLDLGIAAAEVSKNANIEELQNDFNKINEILSSLVTEVQNNLAEIWPTLKFLLKLSGKVDDFMVDFSMKLARNGAWKFATQLSTCKPNEWGHFIMERDKKVARKADLVTSPGLIATFIFWIIRLGERGSVAQKIGRLRLKLPKASKPVL